MYGLVATFNSPLQNGWNDNNPLYNLTQYQSGGGNRDNNLSPYTGETTGCYISQQATSAIGDVHYNSKGTLSISLVKGGVSSGTLTASPFTDKTKSSGLATFTLTVKDSFTGQQYVSTRSITYV